MEKQIAVEPETVFYSSRHEGHLRQALNDCEKDTLVFVLDSPEQVCLSSAFTTIGGNSKLTWLALRQFCTALSKGFYKVIADLCGKSFVKKSDRVNYSSSDAISVYNIVANRRFEQGLQRKQVVRSLSKNTIDFLVSPSSPRISMASFYDSSKLDGLSFSDASVCGRKITVRYSQNNSEFLFKNINFKLFVVFTHSEVSQKFTKANIQIEAKDKLLAVSPNIRLKNLEKSFNEKMSMFIATIDSKLNLCTKDKLLDRLVKLDETNLGLSGIFSQDGGKIEELTRILVSHGVKESVASRVVKSVVSGGASADYFSKLSEGYTVSAPSKTAFDLFMGLISEGCDVKDNQSVRDNIGHTAFKLLFGKVKVSDGQQSADDPEERN